MVNMTTDIKKFRGQGEAVEQGEESSERCKRDAESQTCALESFLWGKGRRGGNSS